MSVYSLRVPRVLFTAHTMFLWSTVVAMENTMASLMPTCAIIEDVAAWAREAYLRLQERVLKTT